MARDAARLGQVPGHSSTFNFIQVTLDSFKKNNFDVWRWGDIFCHFSRTFRKIGIGIWSAVRVYLNEQATLYLSCWLN